MNLFFKENPEENLIYFNGTPLDQTCEDSLWIIFYITLDVSSNQLQDFIPKESSDIFDLQAEFQIFKNKDDQTEYINLVKKIWKPKNFLQNIIIDNSLEIPKF